jgi:hypothetical protein
MNRNLRKAVVAGLGLLALAGVSTQASAQNTTYPGLITSSFTETKSAPAYAWDGNNNGFGTGLGWGHNARWVSFSIGAGTPKLGINLTTTTAGINPAFTLYATTGYTDPGLGSGTGHTFSQVSTFSKSGWLTDPAEGGVTSVKGYANAGPSFINGVTPTGLFVGSGAGGVVTVGTGLANLQLTGVGAGDYLLAYGGSNYLATKGGAGSFKLEITAAVPEPEEYLMMLMGGGMVGFQVKRKKAKQAAAA